MTESRTCSRCGAELPRDAPGGHCLPCLLQLGLQSGETAGGDVAADVPPASEGGILPPGPSLAEKPGDRIGHYRLLQQIGEGGCGVVYMAEQEEPVRRRVALKIIKLGMDTRSVIARFEAERQALAMMDHPNIAKVFDAGVTEAPLPASGHPLPSSDEGRGQGEGSPPATRHPSLATHYGRPYFVMELVRGIKITSYCDQQKLSTRQRLDLFIQVCQAVQHAHQKGIIHRDLKPSNILVTEQDGAPVPKIIDFGIAKATSDQRLTDKTLFTAFEQFIGTPAYMSPEQAGLGGLDIDTRTDIYSLGVLLYELLAGQPPFDPEELRRSALDEILRVIREQEPPRPSTCLTKLTKQELTTVAERRQTEATKLPHLLRGDLDWIVMKALEKDRRRRYETANGLARDLERFVNNEPVTARPPSNLYRFQKLVRRNKLAFVAVGAVSLALLLGFGVSTWEFLKERQARQGATTEAVKSRQVAQLLENMLQGVGPSVALGRDTKLLREILDDASKALGKDLTNQPEVEAEMRYIIGKVYCELAELPKAENMHREALAMRRKLFGTQHPAVASSLNQLGNVLRAQGKLSEAETTFREALAIRSKQFRHDSSEVAQSLSNLGLLLQELGKPAEAEAMHRQALAIYEKLRENEPKALAFALNNLAWALRGQGELAEAETMERDALAINRKLLGNDHPRVAECLNGLSGVLFAEGKLADAETMTREALEIYRKLLSNDHPNVARTLGELGIVLERRGKLNEAEIQYREAFQLFQKGAEQGLVLAQVALGSCYEQGQGVAKDVVEAIKWYHKAAEQGHNEAQYILAVAYSEGKGVSKDSVEAAKWFRKAAEGGHVGGLNALAWRLATSEDPKIRDGPGAVSFAEMAAAKTDRKDPEILDTLAAAYAEVGQFDKAFSTQKEAIALLRDEKQKKDCTARLKLYESNSPYRESQ